MRDQRHFEAGLVERGDGQRDAVDRDRALLDAVAQQLERRLDPHAHAVALGRDRGDRADAVDVALHLVAAERIAGTERRLDVDARRRTASRGASVSGTTSKESRPPPFATTVRQTPAIATESPTSATVPHSTTSRPSSNDATSPTSRTSPVNMLLGYGSRR